MPHVDYGDDKEAQDLVQQETARIEEVEMPAADQAESSLRIAEIDEAAAKEIEPPLMTPTTQEQVAVFGPESQISIAQELQVLQCSDEM